jgi:hypothetical protein
MANEAERVYYYKDGGYTIEANQTQSFSFWWGEGVDTHHNYFDVSISPQPSSVPMTPLVQVEKSVVWSAPNIVLIITLRNDNPFPVNFIANHVLLG